MDSLPTNPSLAPIWRNTSARIIVPTGCTPLLNNSSIRRRCCRES
jgi:hypothetical protein